MSEHNATIDWQRDGTDFTYATYPRRHTMTFDNGKSIEASAAVEYRGDADCVDPEALLAASLSSCHMLTFLAIAAKKKITIDSYRDPAVGTLGKNADGKMVLTQVILRPTITFGGPAEAAPDAATLDALHHSAHEHCFIANSVTTQVVVEAPA